jgi:hypothetical protein
MKYVILVTTLFLTGCIGHQIAKEKELWNQWSIENKKQNTALGEKVYDKVPKTVISAIITGVSSTGLTIKNIDRESGFVLAEGPLPISLEKETELGEEMVRKLRRVAPSRLWRATTGTAVHSFTFNVLKTGDNKTKVKLRISSVAVKLAAENVYHGIYPPILVEEFRVVWEGIEKQLFLDESLDK